MDINTDHKLKNIVKKHNIVEFVNINPNEYKSFDKLLESIMEKLKN